jgi:hypothetical protein
MRAVLFVVLTLGLICAVTASSRRFETHPHVQCSACRAVAAEIGDKMNETAKIRSSVKKGHRLAGKNRVTYQDYESSELRAIEITEKLCPDRFGDYQLRMGSDNVRLLSKNSSLPAARFYGRSDREQLDNVVPRLKDFCFYLLDEHDDHVISAIKTERMLDALVDRICFKAAKVCGTAKVDKARKVEMDKFEKAEEKKRAEAAKRKEAEEASKKEDAPVPSAESGETLSTQSAGSADIATLASPSEASEDL